MYCIGINPFAASIWYLVSNSRPAQALYHKHSATITMRKKEPAEYLSHPLVMVPDRKIRSPVALCLIQNSLLKRFVCLALVILDILLGREHAQTIEELKVLICNAFASVTAQMFQNVLCLEIEYRLYIVRVTKGSRIEHLWRIYAKF
ncbi:hypothetical protein TNCT_298391 [Trichonephila clavata]|uniref:Uncharacterized protein n=1 Tax=Trichonephila clavata TaxID=2740835 RepID=A0A8X6KNG4_TRICU|nr:hypothetical protein TNCT_298391 [Trichonephila clavata]